MIIFKTLVVILTAVLVLSSSAPAAADNGSPVMTREEFESWPYLPEYTIFNPFPSKGSNCTWYAHGRMMQLGYCPYALDSMRFSAFRWADDAARGAKVVDDPLVGSIAFWDGEASFGGSLGHVGVVEKIETDGSILISDSSSSRSAYNLFTTTPGERNWPTAFIKVPAGPPRSEVFMPLDRVQTTAVNLNFRLEGVDEDPVLVPRGTEAQIKAHPSNGIYASQVRTTSSYHHWWYAAVEIEGDLKHGWLAETYLELVKSADPDQDADEPEGNPGDDPLEDHDNGNGGNDNGSHQDELDEGDNPEEDEPVNETDPVSGDVTGDGGVDVRDVTLVMQYILGLVTLTEEQAGTADYNGDGIIDIRDAVLIMQYALGLND